MWPFQSKCLVNEALPGHTSIEEEEGMPFKPTTLTVTYTNGKVEEFKLNDEDNSAANYEDQYVTFWTLDGRTPYVHTIPYASIFHISEEQDATEE